MHILTLERRGDMMVVLNAAHALGRCRDEAAVAKTVSDTLNQFSVPFWSVQVVGGGRSAKPQRLRRWPAGLEATWDAQGFERSDPVAAYLRRATQPVRWSALRAKAGAEETKAFDCLAEHGLHEGYIVPCHRGGVRAGVSLAAGDAKSWDAMDLTLFEMIALHLVDRLTQIWGLGGETPDYRLTRRERECLEWIARGKTDWEIAVILGLTRQTVSGYVRGALKKMDASSRSHAIALALAAGLIALESD